MLICHSKFHSLSKRFSFLVGGILVPQTIQATHHNWRRSENKAPMNSGKNMILLFQATVTLYGKDASECTSAYGTRWSEPSNCANKTGKDSCQVSLYHWLFILQLLMSNLGRFWRSTSLWKRRPCWGVRSHILGNWMCRSRLSRGICWCSK